MSESIDTSTYEVTVTYVIPKAWFIQILKKGYGGPSGLVFTPSLAGSSTDSVVDESETEITFVLPDPASADFLSSAADMNTNMGKLNKIKMIWEQMFFELENSNIDP